MEKQERESLQTATGIEIASYTTLQSLKKPILIKSQPGLRSDGLRLNSFSANDPPPGAGENPAAGCSGTIS